jgi:hypothetical protein
MKVPVAAKVDEALHAVIVERARERGVTVSSLVAEMLESAFREGEGNREGQLLRRFKREAKKI